MINGIELIFLLLLPCLIFFQVGQAIIFDRVKNKSKNIFATLKCLPHGIVEVKSDLESKPLWSTSSSKLEANISTLHNLLAMSVGLKQKCNVNSIVQKGDRTKVGVVDSGYAVHQGIQSLGGLSAKKVFL
ncbi:uncharacterized protein LOC143531288 [Bidens hawaiensis]|uniref:uncharacterized protein LOC143531288 n=1 Tax=Bidens hawaiensis TaxID=980011 RepID=UPI00404A4BDA